MALRPLLQIGWELTFKESMGEGIDGLPQAGRQSQVCRVSSAVMFLERRRQIDNAQFERHPPPFKRIKSRLLVDLGPRCQHGLFHHFDFFRHIAWRQMTVTGGASIRVMASMMRAAVFT